MRLNYYCLPFLVLCGWGSFVFMEKLYNGYRLIRMIPSEEEHLRIIRDISVLRQDLNIDFWQESKGISRPVDILIPPSPNSGHLLGFVNKSGMAVHTLISDLQKKIDQHKNFPLPDYHKFVYGDDIRFFRLNQFHSYDEMQDYMRTLALMYPHLVKLLTVGQTSEGRDMLALKIGSSRFSKDPDQEQRKPAVWIDAGIHAREWIAPATALYVIHQLVVNNSIHNLKTRHLVHLFDWIIVPSLNPDGYTYSRMEDRMWRKTRSFNKACSANDSKSQECCYGCDPNRNWAYKWGGPGTSDDICSDLYHGASPFSEPETKSTAEFIMKYKDSIKVFFTLHSYAQMWLLPFGFKEPPTLPHDFAEMMRVASIGADALKRVHGTEYKVGNSVDLLYPAAGASDDWAKGVAGIKYVYTLELRPTLESDEETAGFMIGPDKILPTAEETFEAIRAVALAVA